MVRKGKGGIMGFLFDFDDEDDEMFDEFEELQMTASSRKEAIELTGDDSFYPGTDIYRSWI